MPKFKVTVEKTQTLSGTVEVEADNADEALNKVDRDIITGFLQSNSSKIEWDDPDYDDGSLRTTGDVD